MPVDDLPHDRQARARSRASRATRRTGRTARRCGDGRTRRRRCPGRRRRAHRRTSRTVTVPSEGLHFAALSSRLVTARSRLLESPTTTHGSVATSKAMPCARRRTRVTARSTTSARSTCATTWVIGSSRASSTRSPTSALSSSIWPRTSSSSSSRASAGRAVLPSAWRSRSRLVRSEVSGVRSSWLASATSRRCRSREAPSASSIWLKAVASRATSSSPSIRSGVRSSVSAIRSTECVRRRTGRSPLRATIQPAISAASTPSAPKTNSTPPSLLQGAVVGREGLGEDQRLLAARPDGGDAEALALVGDEGARRRLALAGDDRRTPAARG